MLIICLDAGNHRGFAPVREYHCLPRKAINEAAGRNRENKYIDMNTAPIKQLGNQQKVLGTLVQPDFLILCHKRTDIGTKIQVLKLGTVFIIFHLQNKRTAEGGRAEDELSRIMKATAGGGAKWGWTGWRLFLPLVRLNMYQINCLMLFRTH